jgi:hypothetical protein
MEDIGLDARLSITLAEWEQEVPEKVMAIARDLMEVPDVLEGKHPPIISPLESVPSSCIHCHDFASTAPSFAPLIHLVHYRGSEANHFLSVFAGECSLCHKMNQRTGALWVPDGSEK